MRLIDADELMKKFTGYVYDTMDPVARRTAHDAAVLYQGLLREQPTAYDSDKVVEQLAAESERWKESGEAYEDQKELGVAEGFKRAIEIVKSGGMS